MLKTDAYNSVFEATSVFKAATKKLIAVPKQKPRAFFIGYGFFSVIDYTTPLNNALNGSSHPKL